MIVLNISEEPLGRREKICHRRLVDVRHREKKRISSEIRTQYDGPLLACAVRVQYLFFLRIPKHVSKATRERMISGLERPTKRPDCSNLIKLIEDVMTGIIYEDDSLIVSGNFDKYWAETGHTILKIESL